jgi:hypothetical protein
MAINAWVTLSTSYDATEVAPNNLYHHSLLQTLLTGKGTCDEFALLKLYALRHTGFAKTEGFWMGVYEYPRPISFDVLSGNAGHHAVAIARIGTQFWVLDAFTNPYRFSSRETVIREAGLVEQLPSYVNFSGHSPFPDTVRLPGHLLNDVSQYSLGTAKAKVHRNETLKRLPAFNHWPEDVVQAPSTKTVLANTVQFRSLNAAYDLNAARLEPLQPLKVSSAPQQKTGLHFN